MANETITSVRGMKAAALHCGIKESGKPDLALLVSDVPASAAAVFTRNKVVGAPVIVGRQHIRAGLLRACITNSGCANVCTGDRGVRDALEMCSLTASSLGEGAAVASKQVLPFSTGVIGRFLPMDKIRAGIPQAVASLSNSEEAGRAFAEGIMTTDLVPKSARATLTLGGKRVSVAGHCKGSGMIAPNMGPPQATMLAYVATDAAVDRRALAKIIQPITDDTFNCVTVDQHTSTSDTFVIMANAGLAGNRAPSPAAPTCRNSPGPSSTSPIRSPARSRATAKAPPSSSTVRVTGRRFRIRRQARRRSHRQLLPSSKPPSTAAIPNLGAASSPPPDIPAPK